jgi:hypothetical protein
MRRTGMNGTVMQDISQYTNVLVRNLPFLM